MTTLAEAFQIPRPEEITALGYVVVLEDQPSPEKVCQIVGEYVLTPAVRNQLRDVLEKLRTALKRGEEMGRFIHGSFGSGKSNFMFYLGLLLDGDAQAWSKNHPDIAALASEFKQFLDDAKILTVRLNMLSLNRQGAGFDRLVYESYNATVRRRGLPECSFLNVYGVLDEVRAEAAQYGKATWDGLAKAGIVPSQADFEELAKGSEEDREALALEYLRHKKRDPSGAGIIPAWAKGLDKLAAHAKTNGLGAVVFFVDELLLWLTEKQVHEFNEAVNQLSVIVDHAGGRRAVPLIAFVARQRRLSDFFPDRAQDDQIHDLFDRIAKRFETTALEDVELRFICKERVLRRKTPDVVQPVLESLAVEQRKVLEAVIQQADVEYLKDVYPFHPALIEALIDVSALLQRERTALRLLTELLAASRDLPLGKFIPVGRAFELLIPEPGVEGAKAGEDDLKALHRHYWKSIRPALEALRIKGEDGFDDQRRAQLDQLLKTALLAEVSPRLKQGGVTLDRLVRLNDADIKGETDRGRISQAFNDVVKLTRLVPSIQLLSSGEPYGATMQVNLRGGNLAEVLERARPRVDNVNTRFKTFYSLLGEALGSDAKAALQDGASQKKWTQKLNWRGSRRTGSVMVANVRTVPAPQFKPEPGEEFRILIDYPWDEQNFSVDDDRNKAKMVRKSEGTFATICWLPRHFTQGELDLLRDLAAAELLTKEGPARDELLKTYGTAERDLIVSQAQSHASTLRTQASLLLPKLYKDNAVVEPLIDVPDDITKLSLPENLESFGGRLLDRRFALHPAFDTEPKPELLQRLCDFIVPAAEAGGHRDYGEHADLIRKLAGPAALDLVELGQERGKFRDSGRIYKDVMQLAQGEIVQWDLVDKKLAEGYGLTAEVRNFFLTLVARIHSYRIIQQPSGEELTPDIDRKPRQGVILKRAKLLDVAPWAMAGDLVQSLLNVAKPTAGRTVAEQDALASRARTAVGEVRNYLQQLKGTLLNLGVSSGSRVDEVVEALRRLAPLADNTLDAHEALSRLLGLWPSNNADPVRVAVQKAKEAASVLEKLNRGSFDLLERAKAHAEAQAHVAALRATLAGSFAASALTEVVISVWNANAHRIVEKMIEPQPNPQPPVPQPPFPNPPGPEVQVLKDVALDLDSPSDVERVLADVRKKLGSFQFKNVTIDVVVRRQS